MPLTKEKKAVIKAINLMGRHVSAADVASNTGLPVAVATQTLNQIAEEASGQLEVTKLGDIAYRFPLGYQTAYLSRGIKRYIEKGSTKLFEWAFFLLRISFGIMLILSLVTIVLLFFLLISAMSRGRDDEGRDNFSFDFDFFDWMILRDLIYWQISYPTYNDPKGEHKSSQTNFLYNCFSFLFGDGNPNSDIEKRRWHTIAQLIRQQKGVVTAEQLAPYTDGGSKDEDKLALPVLVRFDGRPAVTESGNIVYLFPALQATTSMQNLEQLAPYLKAYSWRFSKVDTGSLVWVTILAAINFFGAWFLYIQGINILPSLAVLLSILLVYGNLFIGIPLIRYIAIQVLNKKIENGNIRRKQSADLLTEPSGELSKKLNEAKEMSSDIRQINRENLVYDTEKEVLEQEFNSANNS